MHLDAVFIHDGFSCETNSNWPKGDAQICVFLILGLQKAESCCEEFVCLTLHFSCPLVSARHYSSQRKPPHGRQDGCQKPCC